MDEDERVEAVLRSIESIYFDPKLDREETLQRLERIKERVDALHEDLI